VESYLKEAIFRLGSEGETPYGRRGLQRFEEALSGAGNAVCGVRAE